MQFKSAAARRLWVILIPLLFGRLAPAADVLSHEILAHGDNNTFWVARVEQLPNLPKSLHTNIYYRVIGEEGKWHLLTPTALPARVVSLASQNSMAAALLDDGTWMLLYPDSGPFTAGPLPEPARMIALAGGPNSWWAIGVVPGGIAGLNSPATMPSTRLASTTQIAATGPATHSDLTSHLVLFYLAGNNWTARSELADAAPDAPTVSLRFFDDKVYVADLVKGGVRVRHLEGTQWILDADLRDWPNLAGFDLVAGSPVPRLWVQPTGGAGRLYAFNKKISSVELPGIPNSTPNEQALTFATGRLRMVALVGKKIVEQDFNEQTGKPEGAPAELPIAQANPLVDLTLLRFGIILAALLVAMFGSIRQRAAMKGLGSRIKQISLAPAGKRLLAGLIDAAPIILAAAVAAVRFQNAQITSDQSRDLFAMIIYWSASIFYVVYMTIIEALAGRSLGKVLLGLRIIGLDGKPAQIGALVMRNVLRLIDVLLFLLPLVMIVVFPLRQRAGDIAAGTLVVSGDGTIPTDDQGKADSDSSS